MHQIMLFHVQMMGCVANPLWDVGKFSSLATLVAVLLAPGSHFPGDRNGTGVHGTDLWLHKAIQHIHRYNN